MRSILLGLLISLSAVLSLELHAAMNAIAVGDGLDRHVKVNLEGPWDFFPAQLLEPGASQDAPQKLKAGKPWDSSFDKLGFRSSQGYATYRLKITGLNALPEGYELALRSAASAYQAFLYPEDQPREAIRFSNGTVGQDAATSVPSMLPQVVAFHPKGPEQVWVILIQVSNFHYAKSGLWVMPELAKGRYLSRTYQIEHEGYVICISVSFVMLIYSLALYLLRIGKKTFLFAFLFCLTNIMRTVGVGYMLAYYGMTDGPAGFILKFWLEYTAVMTAPIFYLLLLDRIFGLQLSRKILNIFFAVATLSVIYITLAGPAVYSQHLYLFQMFLFATAVTLVFVMIHSLRKHKEGAGYACLGALILILSFLYDLGVTYNFVPYPYTIQYGSCLFILMQALVIAKTYKALSEQNNHAFHEMKKIVYQHQLQRIRLGAFLEDTMPTHIAQACVLSFDMISSSKIKHVNSKKFFRNVFAHCNQEMAKGYDGVNLKANAYRIKEMGDGFLCSIGYPFESLTGNAANDAIDIARRFAEILAEESILLDATKPVYCGIGIALDAISGFYPESGTMDYDVFGNAIVLATRYEGMRKVLFEAEQDRSVIIIQELVYQSLDAAHKAGFIEMNLQELGVVVRDDPTATKLYYQFLRDRKSSQDSGSHSDRKSA